MSNEVAHLLHFLTRRRRRTTLQLLLVLPNKITHLLQATRVVLPRLVLPGILKPCLQLLHGNIGEGPRRRVQVDSLRWPRLELKAWFLEFGDPGLDLALEIQARLRRPLPGDALCILREVPSGLPQLVRRPHLLETSLAGRGPLIEGLPALNHLPPPVAWCGCRG